MSLLDRLVGLLRRIGRGPLANPETNAEGNLAPTRIRRRRGLTSDSLTGADERGSALELLQRE